MTARDAMVALLASRARSVIAASRAFNLWQEDNGSFGSLRPHGTVHYELSESTPSSLRFAD
jgi:hypothetical protein